MSDTFHRAKIDLFLVSVLYFLAVAMFFSPIQFPCKLAVPVAILFLASFKLLPWQMAYAMLFSCIGDYMGAIHDFMGQMAAFAMAHVFIICYFVSRYRLGVLRRKYGRRLSLRYMIAATIFIIPLLAMAFIKIVPAVPEGILTYGVTIYAILISTMLWCAMQQRSILFALGAALFLASDIILAYNRFVEPLPNVNYLILIPYFLSQWLLFIRSTKWWGRKMEKE